MTSTSSALLLAVDPASRKSGVALFSERELLCARAADVRSIGPGVAGGKFTESIRRADNMGREIATVAAGMTGITTRVTRIVIEYPRVYKTGPANRLPSDDVLIIAAAAMSAWVNLSAFYPDAEIEAVRPQDWKGQVPKEAMCDRILSRLSPQEKSNVQDLKNDNIIDAIGIGLYASRRA